MFMTGDQPAEVLEPSEQAFDLPAAAVAPQRAAILRLHFAVAALPCDQLDAFFVKVRPERVAIVGLVADEPLRRFLEETGFERGVDKPDFMRRSAGHVNGDRKTMAVCNCHDLCTLAPLGGTHTAPPFLAPAKEPSMNPSDKSSF